MELLKQSVCLLMLTMCCTSCAPLKNRGDDSAKDVQGAGDESPVYIEPLPAPSVLKSEAKRKDILQSRIELALDHVKGRPIHSTHSSWTVFHGILGVGMDLTLLDPDTGKRVGAIEWILEKPEKISGLQYLEERPWGLDVQIGPPGLGQGHQDQYVAEIAQWGMPLSAKVLVPTFDGDKKVTGRTEYTFEDFVKYVKARASVTKNQELSWTIMVLSHYYGTDFSWTNRYGEKLHFTDLVRAEVDASIEEAACGGTHRLFGLTWAYYVHRNSGGKDEGVWKDVKERIAKYEKMARLYQNDDGTFSTQYVSKKENEGDTERRINTTGHVLEWLSLSLTDEELKKYWVQKSVNALALLILARKDSPLESGSLYHAAHGLQMYYARVYGKRPGDSDKPAMPSPPID